MTANNKVYILEPRYDVAIITGSTVHIRSQYDYVKLFNVDDTIYTAKQYWHHVWNEFDDFAWKVGLTRLPGESNIELKLRVYDVNKYYPTPSEQGYIYGILRDLGESHFSIPQSRLYAFDQRILVSDETPIKITIGYKNPLTLDITHYVEEDVLNANNVKLYTKYKAYGNNPVTGDDDVLLFTVELSTIELNFDIIYTYEELLTVDYFYQYNEESIIGDGKQFIIMPFVPPIDPYLEVFRISDYDRLVEAKHGYYANERPTQKLLDVVKQLKKIDNTTFNNYIANESRFDMGSKYLFGNTSIPQYWQE